MSDSGDSSDLLYLGIDVGGTDTKVGLADGKGAIVARRRTATAPLGSPQNIFEYAMQFACEQLSRGVHSSRRLAAVGLAVPGVLDSREWALREVVNLPGWLGVPLQSELHDVSQLPSAVVNDANAAAFAEHTLRGLESQSLALVTLGTGIGCGVVLRGIPYGGDHGCAGELGHIAIEFGSQALPCTCGSRGHLESYAGAAGVMQRLADYREQLEPAALSHSLRSHDATPRDLAREAEAGDRLSRKVIAETGTYVGRAIGLIGQTLDPAVVLLGGAMTFGGAETETGRMFLKAVREAVWETTLVQVGGNMSVDFASLGNDAGMLGAAMVAKVAEKA